MKRNAEKSGSYRDLPDVLYTDVSPVPVSDPHVVVFNNELAVSLGLAADVWNDPARLSGNAPVDGFAPLAQAYAGHQFGHLAMLGDGRAHLIAEIDAPDGTRFDVQLKGSGRTRYSRGGDGRATLGPMLREYLVSEAMHALTIPTTRSLSVVTTGEDVRRERIQPGAILTRVARSHLRVGTFYFAASQKIVRELADYAINLHDPDCLKADNPYLCFFKHVIRRQAELIAAWQSVGFIHGVMNTDNMAISGETIDYGPCAFMDTYRANQVYSSIDHLGRYSFANQPAIAKWNLARLAETLVPVIDGDPERAVEMLNAELSSFDSLYEMAWRTRFGHKLGITATPDDDSLIEGFLTQLENEQLDFTNAFLHLTDTPEDLIFSGEDGVDWQQTWRWRVLSEHSLEEATTMMQTHNPRVIPRNLVLNEALEQAERGNFTLFFDLLKLVQNPFTLDVPEAYQQPAPADSLFITYCGT